MTLKDFAANDNCIADKIFNAEFDSEVLNAKLDAEENFCAAKVEVAKLAELERHTFND